MKNKDELEAVAKKYLSRFAKEGPHGWIEKEAPALTELLLEIQVSKEQPMTSWYHQMIEYFKY